MRGNLPQSNGATATRPETSPNPNRSALHSVGIGGSSVSGNPIVAKRNFRRFMSPPPLSIEKYRLAPGGFVRGRRGKGAARLSQGPFLDSHRRCRAGARGGSAAR